MNAYVLLQHVVLGQPITAMYPFATVCFGSKALLLLLTVKVYEPADALNIINSLRA